MLYLLSWESHHSEREQTWKTLLTYTSTARKTLKLKKPPKASLQIDMV